MPRDDAAFDAFLGEVVTLLDLPEPPAPGRRCEFCRYRSRGEEDATLGQCVYGLKPTKPIMPTRPLSSWCC